MKEFLGLIKHAPFGYFPIDEANVIETIQIVSLKSLAFTWIQLRMEDNRVVTKFILHKLLLLWAWESRYDLTLAQLNWEYWCRDHLRDKWKSFKKLWKKVFFLFLKLLLFNGRAQLKLYSMAVHRAPNHLLDNLLVVFSTSLIPQSKHRLVSIRFGVNPLLMRIYRSNAKVRILRW